MYQTCFKQWAKAIEDVQAVCKVGKVSIKRKLQMMQPLEGVSNQHVVRIECCKPPQLLRVPDSALAGHTGRETAAKSGVCYE